MNSQEENNSNLQQAAAALNNNSADVETGEIEEDRMTVHCAVNHVPADGENVLVRIKELGTESPTYKMLKSAFGGNAALKGENFTASIDNGSLCRVGHYLQGGDPCIIARDGGGSEKTPFDAKAYMASLKANDNSDVEAPFNTEG